MKLDDNGAANPAVAATAQVNAITAAAAKALTRSPPAADEAFQTSDFFGFSHAANAQGMQTVPVGFAVRRADASRRERADHRRRVRAADGCLTQAGSLMRCRRDAEQIMYEPGPWGDPAMAIPDYQTFMRPLLGYAADGTERNIGEAINALSEQFLLSEEDRAQMLPSGKQTIAANRVHWARTYLHKAGALENTRRSHFRITDRGRELLAKYPDKIDVRVLRQFPEFVDFQSTTNDTASTPTEGIKNSDSFQPSSTPDERITSAVGEIAAKLETDLLDRIAEKSPTFFEALVVDLIVAMGYGGSRENVVQRIGKSGDEGIDGIVNEDPLGLDVVYVQAKKYDREQTIGREKIQQFAGALVGKNASKGVFVATCSYSKGAIEYAHRVPQRLILIDAKELARLLMRYGVGVRVERDIQIKRIDLDYFDTED